MHTLLVGQFSEKQYHVYHMCSYPEKPTQVDIDFLVNKLKNDDKYGMVDRMDDMVTQYAWIDDETNEVTIGGKNVGCPVVNNENGTEELQMEFVTPGENPDG